MPIVQVRQSSFAAGEVSPSFFGRTDFAKFDIAARKVRNWLVGPQGSLFNRPGTTYCATTKTTGDKVRLIKFQFSDDQGYVMEFGDHYVRFYQHGAQVPMPSGSAWAIGTTYAQYEAVEYSGVYYVSRVGGNLGHTPPALTSNTYWIRVGTVGGPLEIWSPYALADLEKLKFAQSGDVITFASASHPPYNLSRYPNAGWIFEKSPIGQTAYKYTKDIIYDRYFSYVNGLVDGVVGLVPTTLGAFPTAATLESYKRWGYAITAVIDGVEYLPDYLNEMFMLPTATKPAYNSSTTPRGQPIHVIWASNYAVDEFRIYKGRGGPEGTYGLLRIVPGDETWAGSSSLRDWTDDGSLDPDFSTPPPKGGMFPGTNIEDNGGVIPSWATSTIYHRFDRVVNGTHVYEAENTGKSYSSAGPSHVTGTWRDIGTHGPWLWSLEKISFGVDDLCISNGRMYKCTVGGTIVQVNTPTNGPSGALLGIVDGTVTWDYTGEAMLPVKWRYVGEVDQVYSAYPQVVLYANQRLIFANSLEQPAHIWGSQVGNYVNFFDYSLPSAPNDPYDFELAYNTYEEIRGFVPTPKALLSLTSNVEWVLGTATGDPISATAIDARPNSQRGCEWVDPMLVGNAGIFIQARVPRVRELMFNFDSASYGGFDLSMLSTHLFDGFSIVDWDYTKVPFPIIWLVRSDGRMLAVTYAREQEFVAWHTHDTGWDTYGDTIEQVCVLSEADPSSSGAFFDAIYVVVKRDANRYVERFYPRFIPRLANGNWDTVRGVFVDSAVVYRTVDDMLTTGTLVSVGLTIFTGLDHLEGRTVRVLIDGNAYGSYTVVGGQIDVSAACPDGVQTRAIIGLEYPSDVEFLPPKIPGQDIMRSNVKLLPRISFEVADSRGETLFGPDYNHLLPWRQRDVKDSYGYPTPFTGLGHVRLTGVGYDHDVTLCIRQTDPLPVNLLAVEREIDVGGD